MTAQDRYVALDGLRGFAVLLVFCVHAAGNSAAVALNLDLERTSFTALHSASERLLFWLYRSHHGVFLFFVLSGFLIGRMWWRNTPPEAALRAASPPGGPSALGRPGGARPVTSYARFAWRRTLRIYPAFLVSFVASLGFAYYSGTWTPPDIARVIGNAFFLNGAPGTPVAPFNIVTWSLFYEMTFYFAFPLAAMLAAARGQGVALWVLGIALPAVAALAGADIVVVCWSLLFVGVALAVHEDTLSAKVARIPGGAVVVAYLAVTTAAMLDALPVIAAMLAFGAVTLLVVAKSLASGNLVSQILTCAPLRALGRVSYSFYLVHWMIVVLVARAVDGVLGPLPATLAIFLGGFALCALTAAVCWWLAERPYFARKS